MNVEAVIGENIQAMRTQAGMTQAALGERLGAILGKPWSRSTVSQAESGDRAFAASDLTALATVLGCEIQRLFPSPDLSGGCENQDRGNTQPLSRAAITRMRELRLAARLSARQMAEKMSDILGVEVSRHALANLEVFRKDRVTLEELYAAAKIFNVSISYLVGEVSCGHCSDRPPAGFKCTHCGRDG